MDTRLDYVIECESQLEKAIEIHRKHKEGTTQATVRHFANLLFDAENIDVYNQEDFYKAKKKYLGYITYQLAGEGYAIQTRT